jgi:ATP-dependent helicase/nuclease subunit B
MTAIEAVLDRIAAERQADPLAPVTVIVPSRLAGLQLRRRLARRVPFANVRFEVVSRLAELIAASELANEGRLPLARPIGDYAAGLVARESRGPLASVADLTGYARALRQTFRRFRRGGLRQADDIAAAGETSQLPEIVRLFGRFRELTAAFYDEDDLLETAALMLRTRAVRVQLDVGSVYVVPPARLSAAAAAFLDAIATVATTYEEVEESTSAAPVERFTVAPDPASEARCIARDVVLALQDGISLQDVAVFYGGDQTYRSLIPQTFEAAGIPVSSMPGTPLNEHVAGRGVLALARLPLADYSRSALFDFLAQAPLREWVPTTDGNTPLRATQWQRIAREAGVTHGIGRWLDGLELFVVDREEGLAPASESSDARRRLFETDVLSARQLRAVVEHLAQRLEPLRVRQRARDFIPAFLAVLDEYLRPNAEGLAEVRAEVEQLGTVDSIGGDFDLASFVEAFEANLAAASFRERALGDGVLVTDYRMASGLRFRRVFVCGAYEGVFPSVTGSEALLQDDVWSALRGHHPHVEDLERRQALAEAAAARVLGAADGGILTWSCPVQAAGARHDYYPSALMIAAAQRHDPAIRNATDLRRAHPREWLARPASPLASMLRGNPLDHWEHRLREAIILRRDHQSLEDAHPLRAPTALLNARRGSRFSEFDGNLGVLRGLAAPAPGSSLSPTTLQEYATCGFRYFLSSVLRLRGVADPEEPATISAAERGTLVHKTLERFFREQRACGRPQPRERWTAADVETLLAIFEEQFERLRRLGRAGLEVYAGFDRRVMRADLTAFLDHDSDFRVETGAVPAQFELRVPPTPLGDIKLTGFVDRIDRSPDGSQAFVIDYKTGRAKEYDKANAADPFLAGTKLQLPVYVLAAAGAEQVQALYWFVTAQGEFKRVNYDETPEKRERFENTVKSIIQGVRAGSFPAVPGLEDEFYGGFANCRYCDYDRLCGRRRTYEHQEKQDDVELNPWRAVAASARGEHEV